MARGIGANGKHDHQGSRVGGQQRAEMEEGFSLHSWTKGRQAGEDGEEGSGWRGRNTGTWSSLQG